MITFTYKFSMFIENIMLKAVLHFTLIKVGKI